MPQKHRNIGIRSHLHLHHESSRHQAAAIRRRLTFSQYRNLWGRNGSTAEANSSDSRQFTVYYSRDLFVQKGLNQKGFVFHASCLKAGTGNRKPGMENREWRTDSREWVAWNVDVKTKTGERGTLTGNGLTGMETHYGKRITGNG